VSSLSGDEAARPSLCNMYLATVSGNRGRNFTSSLPFLRQWCGAAHVRLLSQITDLQCPHSALFDANCHDAHSAYVLWKDSFHLKFGSIDSESMLL